ncbi:hypothetical protein [Oscillatoria sp. FACHB-1407]
MDAFVGALLLLALIFSSLPKPPAPPPRSEEEVLGEAIGKYLKKGIKINVEISNKSQGG